MRAKRFFVPPPNIREGTAILSYDQARHLRQVLRLGTGDTAEVFDGEGVCYEGTVEIVSREVRIVSLKRLKASTAESPNIVLAAAIIKPSRFEWMLEKGTELGVWEFIPLRTRFSKVRLLDSKVQSRLERWRRIVREASKQSGRLTVPTIHEPREFRDILNSRSQPDCLNIMLYEKASCPWPPPAIKFKSLILCIGPEGGWDPSEVEAARSAGFQIVSLGPRILRVETAALAAVALIQYSQSGFSIERSLT